VIDAYVLATGLQFCSIIHVFDGTVFETAATPGAVTTWNVHDTYSDSEKPTVVDLAVIVPGTAAVVLTPFKETGLVAEVVLHVTAEAL